MQIVKDSKIILSERIIIPQYLAEYILPLRPEYTPARVLSSEGMELPTKATQIRAVYKPRRPSKEGWEYEFIGVRVR